ncbi:MAG: rRNA pseudouridine synthase [Crocinitomicaceae bacterium]|nr:rRNA pseudouridine synthase [Crocinitomicaceae bacterium]
MKKQNSGRAGARSSQASRSKPSESRSSTNRPDSSRSKSKPEAGKRSGPGKKSDQKTNFRPDGPGGKPRGGSTFRKGGKPVIRQKPLAALGGPMRLNRFISNAGVCSRREADSLIESGVVTVNGEIIIQMGHKVNISDSVQVGGVTIRPEAKRYILLNKPKGFGTSMADAKARRGVHELVQKACKEEIRSIDKLDRESTGLMLFTNDEELMVRLNHPQSGAAKLYHVILAERVQPNHLEQLKEGIIVDKGFVKATEAEFANDERTHIGLKLTSSRSRIARRMLEELSYHVVKVDRVTIGPLTKKDVPRGSFRHLTEAEVNLLRMSS